MHSLLRKAELIRTMALLYAKKIGRARVRGGYYTVPANIRLADGCPMRHLLPGRTPISLNNQHAPRRDSNKKRPETSFDGARARLLQASLAA